MRDALKNYLALASGLTEVTKQQAKNAAKSLVKQGEATRGQVDKLADDLLETSRANRTVLVSIIRTEVDKALGKLGLATADEVAKLTRRLQDLEGALRAASTDEPAGSGGANGQSAGSTASSGTPAKAAATKPAAKVSSVPQPSKAPEGAAPPRKVAKAAKPAKSEPAAKPAKGAAKRAGGGGGTR